MKMTPLTQATGQPAGVDAGAGRTSPDRIERAKAVAAGQSPMTLAPSENNDPQVTRMQAANARRIKMRTQVSPDREPTELPLEAEPIDPTAQSAISANGETADGANEETKPLSPQFAALAKQRRALQQERAALDKEKAELASRTTDGGASEFKSRLKSEPLSVLAEAGVTYEQLTEAILNGQSNPEVARLQARIEQLEKGVDEKLTSRDQLAETQALQEMEREATRLVGTGETFEMVRLTGSVPKAIDLIKRTYHKSGEVLDVSEALELIENELIEDSLKYAQATKIRSRLSPAEENQAMQQQPQGQTNQMRSLSNRDNARPILDKRARAIAAFHGQKNR